MVIDDDHGEQQLLDNTLESEGFDTVVVASGEATPTLLNEFEPDMVILDSTIPGVKSLRELVQIRQHTDIPIIILAVDYDIESLRKALSLGADDYIRKPFDRRAFLARIHAKLRRASKYNHRPCPVTT
jgi:DNA-binding response OmpR family regulator